MGMYTGLRVRAKIKPEYRWIIDELVNEANLWEEINHPIAQEWSKIGRCQFIPWGAICYVPWDKDDNYWKKSFEDGVWQFQCSLKNYNQEIQSFFDIVLSKIAEEVCVCQTQYEGDTEPTNHKVI